MKKTQNFENKIFNCFLNWAGSGLVLWVGPNPAQMHGLGWAQPNPMWTLPSTVHMLREQWRLGRDEAGAKKKGRRADLLWLLSSAKLLEVTGSGAGGWRWRQRRWFFSSLSLLCFSFSFFFRFSVPSLFCSLSSILLSFSLVSLLYFFICSAPHVFIGKNRGGTWLGRPLCRRPSTAPPTRGKFFFGQVGLVDVFLREKWWWKTEKEKSSSSLASRVQGKKKTHRAVQNGIVWVFSFYFREQCMKRSGFGQNAPFHLKGKRRQKCVRVHIDPHFVICSIKS